MRVQVVRRGGFAGIPLRGEADTAQIPGAQAAALEAALRGLQPARPPASPTHPDSFQYELTFNGGSVVLDESEVTDALRPLIEQAMAHSTL